MKALAWCLDASLLAFVSLLTAVSRLTFQMTSNRELKQFNASAKTLQNLSKTVAASKTSFKRVIVRSTLYANKSFSSWATSWVTTVTKVQMPLQKGLQTEMNTNKTPEFLETKPSQGPSFTPDHQPRHCWSITQIIIQEIFLYFSNTVKYLPHWIWLIFTRS